MKAIQKIFGEGLADRQAGGQLGNSPHGLLNGPAVLSCLRDEAMLGEVSSIQQLVG